MEKYVVRGKMSSEIRKVHLRAMEMEKASGGKTPYSSFLPEDVAKARELHQNYLFGLKAEGKLLCAGPMTDYTWALFIYVADSEEGARALVEGDPFLKGGYITDYEINQWHHRV